MLFQREEMQILAIIMQILVNIMQLTQQAMAQGVNYKCGTEGRLSS